MRAIKNPHGTSSGPELAKLKHLATLFVTEGCSEGQSAVGRLARSACFNIEGWTESYSV
jgi:hypothetical protein